MKTLVALASVVALALPGAASAKSPSYPAPTNGVVSQPAKLAPGLGIQVAPDGTMSIVRVSSAKRYRSAHLGRGVAAIYVNGKVVGFLPVL